MPRRCIAFGNNVCGNLDPLNESPILDHPTDLIKSIQCDEILWHSWSCTIGRNTSDRIVRAWGIDPIIQDTKRINDLSLPARIKKVIGFDNPIGYLAEDGYIYTFTGTKSNKQWDDVAVTGLGLALAFRKGTSVQVFKSFEGLMHDWNTCSLSHPLLDPQVHTTIHTCESRIFLFTHGLTIQHVLEIQIDQRIENWKEVVKISLIEEVEGLGVEAVITGSKNRLAILTGAGDAYLFNKDSKQPELLSFGDLDEITVLMIGLGSEHEIVYADRGIWVRGENGFNQLGTEHTELVDTFKRLDIGKADKVIQLVTSRWSNLIILENANND